VRLHPLDKSVKCRHCGKGDLQFVRSRNYSDMYRCLGTPSCWGFTLHSRRNGNCGTAAETTSALRIGWTECVGVGVASETSSA